MRDAALELIDRGTGKARRSMWLDLHEERVAGFVVAEIDPDIELVAGPEMLLVANSDDLCARDALKQSADRVHRRTLYPLLYFVRFHHVVKMV